MCPSSNLAVDAVFYMLDNFIDTAIKVESGATLRVKFQYTDRIHEVLAGLMNFIEHQWRTARSFVISNAVDLCDASLSNRPTFCEQSWADFKLLRPASAIESLSRDLQQRIATRQAAIDSATQVVEMVVVECSAEFRTWAGGLAIVQPHDYDVLTFLRVRNCTDTTKTHCTTVFIDDHRYEGGIIRTNVVHWYPIIRGFRLVGQLYNVGRVFSLLLGCYVARAAEPSFGSLSVVGKASCVFGTFLRIPAQVIIYGSWFPVLLFVLAHFMDSPMLFHVMFRALSTLNGGMTFTYDYVVFLITILSCHMRNVWVLSVVTKSILVANDQHRVGQQLLGFRGYVLPLVSCLSMVFDLRLLSIRNTDILEKTRVAPSSTVAMVRYLHTIPSNFGYWGVYLDLRCLCMAFIGLCVLLRCIGVHAVRARSLVPYVTTAFCNHTMFSTSWNTLFLDRETSSASLAKIETQSASARILFPHKGRRIWEHVLMNVAWMTDPLEYVSHKYWYDDSIVFVYQDKATGKHFYHPSAWADLEDLEPDLAQVLDATDKRHLLSIPFPNRIYFRHPVLCMASLSYLLFFTDIPRSGYGLLTLPTQYYFQVSETMYSAWGPYNYEVIDIHRHSDGSLVGSDGTNLTSSATVWSYKYDTCSIGLRAFVEHYNISGWEPCLLYQRECSSATLDLPSVFHILDSTASTLVALELGTTLRIEYNYKDVMHEALVFLREFIERQWRTARAFSMTTPIDLCDPHAPHRATFCEVAWADYSSLGPMAQIGTVSQHIQARMASMLTTLDLTTQMAEMVVLECAGDFRRMVGGVAAASPMDFDVVTILRVRNCTDAHKTTCTTVYIDDYRYEGSFMDTNVIRWYRLVQYLRFLGQAYSIVRVAALFLGCYMACAGLDPWARLGAAMHTFVCIPAQVIIYGSWCPVLLFVAAHTVDCAMVYALVARAFCTLKGDFVLTREFVFSLLKMLTCHMRSVWVLSLATKALLLADNQHRIGQMLLGFRGYVLPLVSFLSVFLDIRFLAIRDTRVLHTATVAGSTPVHLIRFAQSVPSNYRYWGLFLDALSLCIAGTVLALLLRAVGYRVIRTRTFVPYAVTSYCNLTIFSTSWNSLFLDDNIAKSAMSHVGHRAAATWVLFPQTAQHMLMNIACMTDPIEFASRKLGTSNSSAIFVYRDKTTQKKLFHPWSLHELLNADDTIGDSIEPLHTDHLLHLTWPDRIRCFGRKSMGTQELPLDERPLTWKRVMLAVLSYVLFFTDIPRSGYGLTELPSPEYFQSSEALFSYWGPFNYPIVTISFEPNGTYTGFAGSAPASVAPVWSYRSDTCSIGLRALVSHFNLSGWYLLVSNSG
ncbi:hypothetical protein ACHHYP_08019 [Achlya hypogyna]|uniref:Transmembrane protein n=1 Tax=Achlya hypogyna TaxID=1202772 RepID=A0A1V9YPW5_ACHHY|nr:hypothetical protein ACHHYP_08019 [Achlya hypogyna]